MIRWLRKRLSRKPSGQAPGESGEALTLRLLQSDWRCSCCGEMHHGLMDLAANAPDPWPHAPEYEANSALRRDGDFLSEDFCVIEGQHFLVRAILEIPVRGLAEPWAFGCWSTLSRENFDIYVAGFDSGDYADWGPWFGWLCNPLKGYVEGKPEGVEVHPQPGRQRPKLVVRDAAHPLARAQAEGLTPDAMFALLRAYGHGPTLQ